MSTTVEHDETTADAAPKAPKRFKPNQLALVLGIAMGIFIMVSGVLPQITDWENDNAVHREVFGGIPGAADHRLLHDHPGDGRSGVRSCSPTG